MGWYYGNRTKQDVIDEVTKGSIKHSVRGNTVYAAHKTVDDKDVIIGVYLISYSRFDRTYGYKPMDEGMGPYRYDCPESILKLSTFKSEYADEWKSKCRARAAKNKKLAQAVKSATLETLPKTVTIGRIEYMITAKLDDKNVRLLAPNDITYKYSIRKILAKTI